MVCRRGGSVDRDSAGRFEAAVLGGMPAGQRSGFVVAFGRVTDRCEIDYLGYTREDPAVLEAPFKATASSLGFHEADRVLAVFGSQTPAPHRIEIQLSQGRALFEGSVLVFTPREFQIIAILALNRAPVRTEYLTDTLWPETDPWKARDTLKVLVHRLRARLGRRDAIVCDRSRWSLGPGVAVDVSEWHDLLRRVGAGPLDDAARDTLLDAHAKLINRSGALNAGSPEPSLDAEFERLIHRIAERLVADGFERHTMPRDQRKESHPVRF
jgi:hypothetical protein